LLKGEKKIYIYIYTSAWTFWEFIFYFFIFYFFYCFVSQSQMAKFNEWRTRHVGEIKVAGELHAEIKQVLLLSVNIGVLSLDNGVLGIFLYQSIADFI